MDIKNTEATGKLKISEDVISKITKLTVKEISGVYDFAPGNASLKELVLKSSAKDSVKITLSGGVAQINISVILQFGSKIKDVCEEIQATVKDAVQNMTNVAVSKVSVYVAGVHLNETAESSI